MLRLVSVADLEFTRHSITDAGEMERAYQQLWKEFLEEAASRFNCIVSHEEAAILTNRRGKTGPLNETIFRGSRGKYKKKGPRSIDPRPMLVV